MKRKNIVGLSMKGGRRDQFFLCLLELYPEKERWFLSSLLHVKDTDGLSGDEAIKEWIENYGIARLIVDFPLTVPACHDCQLQCPGAEHCPESSVIEIQKRVKKILRDDEKIRQGNPKKYEQDRNLDDLFDFGRDIMARQADSYLLSRSFKRRLKKGFLPYWNRALDFWVWSQYYDQLLQFFNVSFDSFGNTSLMVQSRFSYLRRHFPQSLELSEAYAPIILIELLRSEVILKRDVQNLFDISSAIESRLDIIKKIERSRNIFIYDSDLEVLCRNPRAFESFLLAVAGQNCLLGESLVLPDWSQAEEASFIVPRFS